MVEFFLQWCNLRCHTDDATLYPIACDADMLYSLSVTDSWYSWL